MGDERDSKRRAQGPRLAPAVFDRRRKKGRRHQPRGNTDHRHASSPVPDLPNPREPTVQHRPDATPSPALEPTSHSATPTARWLAPGSKPLDDHLESSSDPDPPPAAEQSRGKHHQQRLE